MHSKNNTSLYMSSTKSRSSGGKRIAYRSLVSDPEVMFERRERQLVLNRIANNMINEKFHKKEIAEGNEDRKECGVCTIM